MDTPKTYRINGFNQIRCFFSLVFEQKYPIKPQHIALYTFLINQNNRNNWVEWFKCPFDLAMAGACINSKKTYYKCLEQLQEFGLIQYEKGVNLWKAPKIKIEVLKCTATETATVPQSTPVYEQLLKQEHKQVDTHIYKPITNKQKTNNHIKMSEIEISDLSDMDKKYFKIAEEFRQLFIQNAKDRGVNIQAPIKAKYKNWVDPIRLMLAVDDRTDEDLRKCYNTIKYDDFWKKNILSTQKVREKADMLISKSPNIKQYSNDY